jgi:hypothetical protein
MISTFGPRRAQLSIAFRWVTPAWSANALGTEKRERRGKVDI